MLVQTLLFSALVSLCAASLVKRQISIGSPSPLPSQCASTCSPITNEVSLGCPVTACCTTSFETEYYNCLECVGMVVDAGNYSTLQNSLNTLWTTCVDSGFVLPRMELPGQSNSSNATGSSSATALSPSGSSTVNTGAAVGVTWRSGQVEAWIGTAALLVLAGLW